MINRVLIRARVAQTLYATLQSGDSAKQAEVELMQSLQKTHQLYYHFLSLLVELSNAYKKRIEQRKTRFLPTREDINPNNRLTDNRFTELLRRSEKMAAFLEENGLLWDEPDGEAIVRRLLDTILSSGIYADYLKEEDSLKADCSFWKKVCKKYLFKDNDLNEFFEEHSIYWHEDTLATYHTLLKSAEVVAEQEEAFRNKSFVKDTEYWSIVFKNYICGDGNIAHLIEDETVQRKDVGTVYDYVLKAIKKSAEQLTEEDVLLPMFRSEDDREFAISLLHKTLKNQQVTTAMIDKHAKDWEADRIAQMDMILMQMAITELLEFLEIPVNVIFNEYIDFAKIYSTPKSASFINGVLDAVAKELRSEGKLTR